MDDPFFCSVRPDFFFNPFPLVAPARGRAGEPIARE